MPQILSREVFRLWAAQQPRRYERVDGEPIPMAPERAAHARVKNRVWLALDRAIKSAGLPCEAFGDGMTVEIDAETDYEPDAAVHCGVPVDPDAIALPNPVVVVEVLSPSSQSIDKAGKLADYFRVASIQHYLIAVTRHRRIIHHRRADGGIATRIVSEGSIMLDPPGIAIALADIYDAG